MGEVRKEEKKRILVEIDFLVVQVISFRLTAPWHLEDVLCKAIPGRLEYYKEQGLSFCSFNAEGEKTFGSTKPLKKFPAFFTNYVMINGGVERFEAKSPRQEYSQPSCVN